MRPLPARTAFALEISIRELPSEFDSIVAGRVASVSANPHMSRSAYDCKIVLGRFYGYAPLCRYAKAFLGEWFYAQCGAYYITHPTDAPSWSFAYV